MHEAKLPHLAFPISYIEQTLSTWDRSLGKIGHGVGGPGGAPRHMPAIYSMTCKGMEGET